MLRLRSVPFAALMATLTVSPLSIGTHLALAQPDAPAANPPAGNPPDRDGGRPPRGEGNDDRQRGGDDGGPPPEGRPPGGGGPRGGTLMRPDETLAQYHERMLAAYTGMVPDLTEDQKTHILVILDAANTEARAVQDDHTLSLPRQRAVSRQIRIDIPNRIKSALTEAQVGPYTILLAQRAATPPDGGGGDFRGEGGDSRGGDTGADIQQLRERAIKGYEDVLDELSVKQKTAIIKILESANTQSDAVNADTTKTPAQKTVALLQIHDSVNAQVLPLLEDDQKSDWKKAHDAKRP